MLSFPELRSTPRRLLATSPRLYCAVARLRFGDRRNVVTRRTDLLVESYPRSGSTNLVSILHVAVPDLLVASHVHHPAHVRLAQDFGVPAVVLIRDPVNACISMALYDSGGDGSQHLTRWLDFYRDLQPTARDRVIAFDEIVADRRQALETALQVAVPGRQVDVPRDFDHLVDAEIDRRTVEAQGSLNPMRLARPTAEREARKQVVRDALLEGHPALVHEAEDLYRAMIRP